MHNNINNQNHDPGREPSTTSASSSTSSKTSLSAAAKAARSVTLSDDFSVVRPPPIRLPVTRVHPHHLHHHPRFGYLYPADLEANGLKGTKSMKCFLIVSFEQYTLSYLPVNFLLSKNSSNLKFQTFICKHNCRKTIKRSKIFVFNNTKFVFAME